MFFPEKLLSLKPWQAEAVPATLLAKSKTQANILAVSGHIWTKCVESAPDFPLLRRATSNR